MGLFQPGGRPLEVRHHQGPVSSCGFYRRRSGNGSPFWLVNLLFCSRFGWLIALAPSSEIASGTSVVSDLFAFVGKERLLRSQWGCAPRRTLSILTTILLGLRTLWTGADRRSPVNGGREPHSIGSCQHPGCRRAGRPERLSTRNRTPDFQRPGQSQSLHQEHWDR